MEHLQRTAVDAEAQETVAADTADTTAKKNRKRRKKNAPAADAAADRQGAVAEGNENQAPQPKPGDSKKPRRQSAGAVKAKNAAAEAVGAVAAIATSRLGAGTGPLPDGVGEIMLEVENKLPVDNIYQFSKVTGTAGQH